MKVTVLFILIILISGCANNPQPNRIEPDMLSPVPPIPTYTEIVPDPHSEKCIKIYYENGEEVEREIIPCP